MTIKQVGKDILIENIPSFNIEHILECGQCFRFYPQGEQMYILVAHNKLLRIQQKGQQITLFNTTREEFDGIWQSYFDLSVDYERIKDRLKVTNEDLKGAIESKAGIRILRQEPWETLISFIISQNKQIPHIKKIIEHLSEAYGECIGEWEGKRYYTFPTPEVLSQVTEEELRACKTGFRAPYIYDASQKVATGAIDLEALKQQPTEAVKRELLTIKGVGQKISDCVLLYGFGRTEVFPADVWIKRIVENLYFDKEVKLEEIQTFAANTFGTLSGYAQQYLFYYGRESKIGKP